MHVQGLVRFSSYGKELPPLMDSSSPYNSETKTAVGESSYVTCFSNPNQTEDLRTQDDIVDSFENPMLASSYSSNPSNISPASWTFTKTAPTTMCHHSTQIANQVGNSQCSDYFMYQDQSMLKMLIEGHGSSTKQKNQKAQESNFDADISSVMYNEMFHRSFGNQDRSSASLGHVDTGCLWNF